MDRYLLCDIDEDSLKELHAVVFDKSRSDIYLDITSGGGDSYTMLGFHDLIKTSPRRIIGTAYGSCQSAAVLVLAACHVRRASRNTIFMVHEDTYQTDDLHHDVKKAVQQHEVEENLWATLMAESTRLGYTSWRALSKEVTYFGPEMAKSHGLIDKILTYEKAKK